MRAERLLAVVLLLACGGAMAAEFGTLLSTPEERERLERLRRGEPAEQRVAPAPSRPNEVTGFVKRSDGRSTVWIDGVPLQVATPKAAPMLDPGAVRSYPDAEEGRIRLERKPAR